MLLWNQYYFFGTKSIHLNTLFVIARGLRYLKNVRFGTAKKENLRRRSLDKKR